MAVEEKEFVEPVVIDRDEVEAESTEQEVELSTRDKIAQKYAEEQRLAMEGGSEDEAVEEPEQDTGQTEVIVNGRKFMVDNAKIEAGGGLATYQKTLAANEGLQEVAKQRKILEDERKRFIQEQQNYQKNLPPAGDDSRNDSYERQGNGTQNLPSSEDDATLVRKYHNAVYDGDEDLAQELLSTILLKKNTSTASQPQIDPDQIADLAAQRIRHQLKEEAFATEVERARALFDEEFSDIAFDPAARRLANDKTIELMNLHPDWSPTQVTTEAGNQVREWISTITGRQSASAYNSGNKVDDKRRLSSVKAAGGRAAAKPQPQPQTSSSYVENLRKARGQL